MVARTLPAPSHVLLILTSKCNLRCPYCLVFNPVDYWAASSEVRLPAAGKRRDLTIEEVVTRVIPQCEQAGVEAIALTGGEVLLRRGVCDVFRRLGRSSLRWCMDSNMAFCMPAIAETIVESGCDVVFASADGPEGIHNRLRAHSKAFTGLIEGCANLLRARKAAGRERPRLNLNCVVQPGNEHCLSAVVRVARNLEADAVTYQLVSRRRYETRFDAPAALASLDEARTIGRALGVPVSVFPVEQPDGNTLDAWFAEQPDARFFSGCSYIHESLRINPDGTVVPCVENAVGNIMEEDLLDIWHGEAYRKFRARIDDGPISACLRCCNMDPVTASANVT